MQRYTGYIHRCIPRCIRRVCMCIYMHQSTGHGHVTHKNVYTYLQILYTYIHKDVYIPNTKTYTYTRHGIYIHTYTHTYIYTYIHTYMHTCIPTSSTPVPSAHTPSPVAHLTEESYSATFPRLISMQHGVTSDMDPENPCRYACVYVSMHACM